MKIFKISILFGVLCISLGLAACGGFKTFNDYARAGDTIAIATGYRTDFSADDITVTIRDVNGVTTTIPASDPAIRLSVNLYPDPLSSMNVSHHVGFDVTPSARDYYDGTNGFTGFDNDWYQTTVFVDLPASLPTGTARVTVSNGVSTPIRSYVDIIPGTGVPSTFSTYGAGDLNPDQLAALTRVEHYAVRIDNTVIPAAVELEFSHDPDLDNNGTGKAFVVNPTGFNKNILWNDDGNNLKVIITESKANSIDDIQDFKFYIAGGLQNLALTNLQAFDTNGNPVQGSTATITLAR